MYNFHLTLGSRKHSVYKLGAEFTMVTLDNQLGSYIEKKVKISMWKNNYDQIPKLCMKIKIQCNLSSTVLFPVVHFSEDRESLKTCLSDEHTLGEDFVLHQGVYREVRSIKPEGCQMQNGGSHVIPSAHIGYILLGFKSLDKNFDQVMVDSWKDWTGARHIYMYLPDDLGLARISFYHREAPDSLNMFMYLVLVECHNITNRDRQIRLLDFAQRMRVERMSGYISVYGQTAND
ncbi:hypothetical protein LSTR_LSTR003941 [Laodelphax striatellus]|uniref:DUF7153 domain-containing protein n=1 Tax=Laodelphax striatellus TaxID=195883 RepID=A0A482X999_LAOST|nr:hypothetical protein LSTR_LSTR003941 [Laodelphax striatellus]